MNDNAATNGFPINSEVAQKVWRNFDRELTHKIKSLPSEDREDIRLEILSHLFESAASDSAETEESRIINAIERLGDPDNYLKPLVADILLQQKAKKGYPLAILESFLVAASRGAIHALAIMLLGFAYFHTVMVFIMSIMHIGNPDIGLWLHESGGFALSFEAQANSTQWLPDWFTPIGLFASVSAYWVLNRTLVLILSKTRS